MRRALILLLLAPTAGAMVNGDPVPCGSQLDAVVAFGPAGQPGLFYGSGTLNSAYNVSLVKHLPEALGSEAQYSIWTRRLPGGGCAATPAEWHEVRIVGFYRPSPVPVPGGQPVGRQWVEATLAEAVDWIDPIPFVSPGQFVMFPGMPLLLAGYGHQGPGQGPQGPQGDLLTCQTSVVGDQQPWITGFPMASFSGIGVEQCGPNSHDSGGPILAYVGGELRQIGGLWAYDIGWSVEASFGDPEYLGLTSQAPSSAELSPYRR